MNILLIFPAYSRNRNGMFFPLGLASISACLKAAGHQVTGINFNNYDEAQRLPHLEQLLRGNTFHLVGTGGLSVTMDGVADIVGHVRRLSPASLVVLGGGLITADPLVQFLHLRPDIAVRGEGEETMVELASLLEQGSRDFSQISGIVYWSNGEPRFTPERPAIANLDQLPMEDLATFGMGEYIAMQKGLVTTNYHRTEPNLGPRAIIATSRSCPYRCTFCFHPASQTYRRYSLQRSMETILSIRDTYDVHTFGIVDELFDYGPHRIKEFCQALADHDIKINWVCQLRVNKVSRELLATLKKAGCYLINYGFESGSDTILDSMRKRIKARDVEKAFHLTRKAGIAIQANFLFGDPAESRQTVQESVDFQQRNKMFFIDWSAVIPYPGTPLYHRNMEKGLISDPIAFTRQIADDSTYLWNYAQPRLNMTTMSDQEAQEVYLQLREMCDHNHRQSCARIIAMEQTTACLFHTTLQCPECSGEMSLTISYPPEAANSGKMDPTWPYFGIRGIHVLCQHCLGKMHLPSWYFPPMAARFAVMRNKIEALITEQRPVVVMPALDRYWGTFQEQVKLDGLNIVAAFDTRSHRLGKKFLGVTVEEATTESCKRFSDATFLLLPSGTIKPYLQLLEQAAIGAEQMVNWHGLEEDQLGSLANSRNPTR